MSEKEPSFNSNESEFKDYSSDKSREYAERKQKEFQEQQASRTIKIREGSWDPHTTEQEGYSFKPDTLNQFVMIDDAGERHYGSDSLPPLLEELKPLRDETGEDYEARMLRLKRLQDIRDRKNNTTPKTEMGGGAASNEAPDGGVPSMNEGAKTEAETETAAPEGTKAETTEVKPETGKELEASNKKVNKIIDEFIKLNSEEDNSGKTDEAKREKLRAEYETAKTKRNELEEQIVGGKSGAKRAEGASAKQDTEEDDKYASWGSMEGLEPSGSDGSGADAGEGKPEGGKEKPDGEEEGAAAEKRGEKIVPKRSPEEAFREGIEKKLEGLDAKGRCKKLKRLIKEQKHTNRQFLMDNFDIEIPRRRKSIMGSVDGQAGWLEQIEELEDASQDMKKGSDEYNTAKKEYDELVSKAKRKFPRTIGKYLDKLEKRNLYVKHQAEKMDILNNMLAEAEKKRKNGKRGRGILRIFDLFKRTKTESNDGQTSEDQPAEDGEGNDAEQTSEESAAEGGGDDEQTPEKSAADNQGDQQEKLPKILDKRAMVDSLIQLNSGVKLTFRRRVTPTGPISGGRPITKVRNHVEEIRIVTSEDPSNLKVPEGYYIEGNSIKNDDDNNKLRYVIVPPEETDKKTGGGENAEV